jgi:hypothetical protein
MKQHIQFNRGNEMQAVSLILFLVSVGTILGPIGAVVVTNISDPVQMVIPAEIENTLLGDKGIFQGGGGGEGGSGDSGGIGGLLTPDLVSQTVDITQRTFTLTVNFKNDFVFDLALNAFDAEIQDTNSGHIIGTLSLSNPVTIATGESALVTLQGSWTEQAESFIGQEQTINVNLVNLTIDVNGIIIELSEPYYIGEISLS